MRRGFLALVIPAALIGMLGLAGCGSGWTQEQEQKDGQRQSPPAWGRGLKHVTSSGLLDSIGRSPPRVGAWIETMVPVQYASSSSGRPPRGGVD